MSLSPPKVFTNELAEEGSEAGEPRYLLLMSSFCVVHSAHILVGDKELITGTHTLIN